MGRYVVRIPFDTHKRGDEIGSEIEQAPRFASLLDGDFLERIEEDAVPGVYVVVQKFRGDGEDWTPGRVLDLRNRQWRNEPALLETGMIRRATRSDLTPDHEATGRAAIAIRPASEVRHAPSGKTDTTGSVPADAYKDPVWLRREYVENGRTTIDIAEQCGCTSQNIGYYLRKHKIPRRPRGTPKTS